MASIAFNSVYDKKMRFWNYRPAFQDPNVRSVLPPTPQLTTVLDNDFENQINQRQYYKTDYALDTISPIVPSVLIEIGNNRPWPLIVVNREDEDVLNTVPPQTLDEPLQYYKIDSRIEVLSDEGVEIVLVPNVFDDIQDIQALPRLLQTIDHKEENVSVLVPPVPADIDDTERIIRWSLELLSDESIERIQLDAGVIIGHDCDTDSRQFPDTVKDHLSDEGVEKITLPPTVPALNAWDSDAEQQIPMPKTFGTDDVSDSGVELIILSPGIIVGYDCDVDSKLQPGFVKDHLSDEGVELIVIPPLTSTNTYDDQAEQTIYFPDSTKGHLADESVERIQLDAGVLSGWDSASEQQKENPKTFSTDGLADEFVEKITLPPFLQQLGWDTDAENQRAFPATFSTDDVPDSGVELISYGPGVVKVWLDDAEQQFANPLPFSHSANEDSDNSILIVYGPGVIDGWDTDAESQLLWNNVVRDDDTSNWTFVFIAPPSAITAVFKEVNVTVQVGYSLAGNNGQVVLKEVSVDNRIVFTLAVIQHYNNAN